MEYEVIYPSILFTSTYTCWPMNIKKKNFPFLCPCRPFVYTSRSFRCRIAKVRTRRRLYRRFIRAFPRLSPTLRDFWLDNVLNVSERKSGFLVSFYFLFFGDRLVDWSAENGQNSPKIRLEDIEERTFQYDINDGIKIILLKGTGSLHCSNTYQGLFVTVANAGGMGTELEPFARND